MRKNRFPFAVPVLLFLLGGTASAFTPVGYPGAFWTLTGRDTTGIDGTNTQGFVRQGVAVLRRENGENLQFYGRYNWRLRNVNRDYYNSYTPYVGTMYSFRDVAVGAEFGWPNYTARINSTKDYNVFANWFKYFNLKEWRKRDLIKAFPLTTWGDASYDLLNRDGSSTMGWIKAEPDIFWLPGNFLAGPFVSYDWRLRSRNATYFNFSGANAGFEIGNGYMQLGAQYSWRRYPKLSRDERGVELFLTVYKAWDLARGAR